MAHRTQQQEEQLRALQLERDFQKRAEEAANQDDDEESNDLDNESTQRVQGLLRMAANQERAAQQQFSILSRTNAGNQSLRSNLQSVGGQSTTTGHAHNPPNQAVPQTAGMSGQENSGLHMQPNQQQQSASQSEEQMHVSSNYGTPLTHFGSGQKSYSAGISHSAEDRELQRRIDEVKRKQAELEESQKKQEEHQLHSQQQTYQQSQQLRTQQPLHPGMLRLDNLIINGPMCE